MEGISPKNTPRRGNDTPGPAEQVVQLTRAELQRLMEETGRNALAEHERRTTILIVREITKIQLFRERETTREVERETPEQGSKGELEKDREADFSEVGSREREKGKRREPGISREEVDDVGRQIERLGK
ncbi:UNVERIFIED_CONTAM: hypothetical protein Sangu_2448200 [Sesamum angustifolium]|uniref:Uncharacterized protein n=1 Tax=Sesamum angustifolium TaxID=2727405 RepID=A0AAW2KX32_9LAMI